MSCREIDRSCPVIIFFTTHKHKKKTVSAGAGRIKSQSSYLKTNKQTNVYILVMALEGGPQPGGGMHSPNPRGWLLGKVQAIPQTYS